MAQLLAEKKSCESAPNSVFYQCVLAGEHFAGPDTPRENADCSPTVGRIGKPRPDMDRGFRNREFKAQFSFLAQLWQE